MLWTCDPLDVLGTERWYVCLPRLHYHCLAWHTVDPKAEEIEGFHASGSKASEVPVMAWVVWT